MITADMALELHIHLWIRPLYKVKPSLLRRSLFREE